MWVLVYVFMTWNSNFNPVVTSNTQEFSTKDACNSAGVFLEKSNLEMKGHIKFISGGNKSETIDLRWECLSK
jgi:hypothetical protein